MVLAFLALRGKVVGRKEAPVFLGSWYRKEKGGIDHGAMSRNMMVVSLLDSPRPSCDPTDFPQPPSKRPGVPPVIGLPSGEGLGLPTSSIALIFSAIIEYVDRNGNRQFDPLVDKVVKRIDLTEKEWESIQRGSVDVLDSDATMEQPIPELPSYEYPSDDDSNDNGTTSNDAILTLSSTSLTHSHVLRIRAWTPRFPIISNEQGLLLHPKSSLLRLGLKNYRFKDHRSRLAVECHIIASRREENRTLIHTFSGKAGSIVSNGGGAEGAEVSWTTFPSHAHTISEDSGGNTTHASVNLFSVVGQDLEKKEMDLLLSKVPKVVSKSLGQYQSVKARKVVWSFGGEAQAHSMFWWASEPSLPVSQVEMLTVVRYSHFYRNVTIGQGTDAVPYPLNELLPSQQHGPPFTHTILWTVGSVFLFAGIGMIAASVVIGVGRSRRKRTDV